MGKKFFHLVFDKQPCYIIADIHGAPYLIPMFIEKYDIRDCILIVAGDIGLGFQSFMTCYSTYHQLNKTLEERDIKLLLVRGNHDDKSYFDDLKINMSHVKSIPDYTVVTVGDENILCVGGGVSIDRLYRIKRYGLLKESYKEMWGNVTDDDLKDIIYPLYFENEQVVFDEEKLTNIDRHNININYVVTHSAPSFCFPMDKTNIQSWIKNDPPLDEDLEIERKLLTQLFEHLKKHKHNLKHWVYGHFHMHHSDIHEDVKFTTLVNMDKSMDFIEINVGDRN